MGSDDKGTRRHGHVLVLKNGVLLGFDSGLKTEQQSLQNTGKQEVSLPGPPELL